MNNKLLSGLAISAALLVGCNQEAVSTDAPLALETLEQKASYAFGLNLGKQFKSDDIAIDIEALSQALRDVNAGTEPRLTQEQIQATMQAFQQKLQAKRADAAKVVSDANQKEGESFLAENGKKEGVVTTASGLQYKVLTAGTGPKPTPTDTVTVHYRGTLLDGTEFDSSYGRGEPVSFPVTGVIPGWVEALQLMTEGAKWELYIPSELAYGAGGTGGPIGPNATLIFEVELLKANNKEGKKEEAKS